jgi:hypothetical protein
VKKFLISFFIYLCSLAPLAAKHYEVHGDAVLTNDWTDGLAGVERRYRSFIDYRLETKLNLYDFAKQKGRLISRIQGTGFIDENIDGFFDDQLIDIPELFWQNDYKHGNNDLRFVFGKFANRRFFNKDEINPDPFDIGEMRFSGQIANTLNLLSSLNEFRDSDLRLNGSRQASGSYGFNLGVKNQNQDGRLLSRWGFQQAFAVSQLDNFSNNFYGISEINKDWGKELPGKLSMGLVYANDQVYRLTNSDGNSYLVYSSLAQRLTSKTRIYLRYGSLFRDLSPEALASHEYRFGFYHAWTKRIGSHHWLGYFDGNESLPENDGYIQWVNSLTYKLTENLKADFATVFRFNQFSSNASNLEDNNYTLALQLRYAW